MAEKKNKDQLDSVLQENVWGLLDKMKDINEDWVKEWIRGSYPDPREVYGE